MFSALKTSQKKGHNASNISQKNQEKMLENFIVEMDQTGLQTYGCQCLTIQFPFSLVVNSQPAKLMKNDA